LANTTRKPYCFSRPAATAAIAVIAVITVNAVIAVIVVIAVIAAAAAGTLTAARPLRPAAHLERKRCLPVRTYINRGRAESFSQTIVLLYVACCFKAQKTRKIRNNEMGVYKNKL
jgi:hypothetical protein